MENAGIEMNLEQALAAVNIALHDRAGRYLSDVERLLFEGAWQGHTYEAIADRAGYSASYLKRDVGPKFWQLLGQALAEPVSKTNFRSALERYWKTIPEQPILSETLQSTLVETPPAPALNPSPLPQPPLPSTPTLADWGEAIDVSLFFGRTQELADLQHWIGVERCRLVLFLGMGGIGKTSLSVRLAQALAPKFERVIWRSLRNAPPLEAMLGELIAFISDQRDGSNRLSRLVHWLRSVRCLVVLDNVETILEAGDRVGQYQPGYEGYGELLRLFGETDHQSCLVLTSREKPLEIVAMEDRTGAIRSLHLTGDANLAQALLETKGLVGSEAQRRELCDRYGNNPLALKIVSTSIRDLFEGDIAQFLAQDTIIFNSVRRLLDQQFNRLSPLEKTIMFWLALNRNYTSIAALAEAIVPRVSRAELLESLESLYWRSLIERQSGCYTQQPVVMEYVTDALIEHITTEILEQRWDLFAHLALLQLTVQDYIQDSQRRLIVEPIARALMTHMGDRTTLTHHLQVFQSRLRESPALLAGYAAGNLINLCHALPISLTHWDFSGLKIWHADLRNNALQYANFQDTELTHVAFAETLGIIFTVAFSPDGTRLAAGDSNGDIWLWRVETGQPELILKGHTDDVRCLAFSPDGRYLASGGADGAVKLWDGTTGFCVHTQAGSQAWVLSLAFSPDGQQLVSACSDRTIQGLHWLTGETWRLTSDHSHWIWGITYSPDGQWFVTCSADRTIKVWDAQTRACVRTLLGHGDLIWAIVFSPDGSTLASCSRDCSIKLWNFQTGQCDRTLLGHSAQGWCVAFSPDGSYLVSGSADRTLRLWDTHTGQCLHVLRGHSNSIRAVAFSPTQPYLVSGSHDQMIKLWDRETGQCLRTFQGYTEQVLSVALSPREGYLASGHADFSLRIWQLDTQQCPQRLIGHTGWIEAVQWSPGGQWVVSASHDRTVRVWEVQTGRCLHVFEGNDWMRSVCFASDHLLAGAGDETVIRLWNLTTGTLQHTLEGHTSWVWGIAAQGNRLASGSTDGTVRLWAIDTGMGLHTLRGHEHWIKAIAFSPDGHHLVSGSHDHTVRVWEVQTGELLQVFTGHTDAVQSVAISPDGTWLVSASSDQTLRRWDLRTGKALQILEGHTGIVQSVIIHPAGSRLISAGADGTLKVWDVETGSCQRTLRADRPYEGLDLRGAKGITDAQRTTLQAMGAWVDSPDSLAREKQYP